MTEPRFSQWNKGCEGRPGGLNSSKTALKKLLDCNLGTKAQKGRWNSESLGEGGSWNVWERRGINRPGRFEGQRRRKSGLLCSDPGERETSEALTHVEHVSGATQPRAGVWYLPLARFRNLPKFCRNHDNELSSQIKQEMGAGSPLGQAV